MSKMSPKLPRNYFDFDRIEFGYFWKILMKNVVLHILFFIESNIFCSILASSAMVLKQFKIAETFDFLFCFPNIYVEYELAHCPKNRWREKNQLIFRLRLVTLDFIWSLVKWGDIARRTSSLFSVFVFGYSIKGDGTAAVFRYFGCNRSPSFKSFQRGLFETHVRCKVVLNECGNPWRYSKLIYQIIFMKISLPCIICLLICPSCKICAQFFFPSKIFLKSCPDFTKFNHISSEIYHNFLENFVSIFPLLTRLPCDTRDILSAHSGRSDSTRYLQLPV